MIKRYIVVLLVCWLIGPSAALAQSGGENDDICFTHDSASARSWVILQMTDNQLRGVEFGNTIADTGESWGYLSILNGERDENALNITIQTSVDGDEQRSSGRWTLSDDALQSNIHILQKASCDTVWEEYAARGLNDRVGLQQASAGLGRILTYPAEYHDSPAPHELRFTLPIDGIARSQFASDPFYAIILTSTAKCDATETQRTEIQALFKGNKVFMDRFQCEDGTDLELVSYTNVSSEFSFIAVHAGSTQADAEALMSDMNLAVRFPGANIRQMQAVLNFP